MSHTRTLLFGYTIPGSHFYFVSSFAALGLCNHTSRSITTLPWTLPKGRTTILIPTLGRALCEGSGIHLLGDINLPWKDNVEQTALEEYAQTFIQKFKKTKFSANFETLSTFMKSIFLNNFQATSVQHQAARTEGELQKL